MPAIRDFVDRLRMSAKLQSTDFQLTADDALATETCLSTNAKMFVFGAVRELLSNISRHAAASLCGVSEAAGGGSIRFEVWDNGRGFDLSKVQSGVGIASVRKAMEVLGGYASFSSQLGNGTTFF